MLAVSLAALAYVASRYWPPPDPAAATPPASNPQQARTGEAGAPAQALPEPLKLGTLEPVPDEPDVGRNPFRFGVRPAPPPPPMKPAPLVQPKPEPAGPPPIPPIRLELTGLTTFGDGRVLATLKDPATGALLTAFEGQIIDGRYRLVKVGRESVVVSYLDGSGPRTLPIR
jgi:hypothetical protein